MFFTQEELKALKRMVEYTGGHVSLEDEPLLNILHEKLEEYIEEE